MAVQSIKLNNRNRLASKYVKGKLPHHFPYDPFHSAQERVNDLKERSFPREELVSILTNMNKSWDAPQHTLQQIERLREENSVVVIGGQQAGLLTGPLYTIHKIISIIKYAKEQEARLNIPVVPVFWIAGEDHDYDEINHIYTTADNELNKRIIEQEEWQKKSVSHIPLDQSLTEKWVKQVFHDLTETEYTRDLSAGIMQHVKQSDSFVDFFARLIFQLFADDGIVLIDSANEQLRYLESEVFIQLIHQQTEITNAIVDRAQKIHYEGHDVQVDVDRNDGNLFYHDDQGERILLVRDNSLWIGKHGEVSFTTEQMLEIAKYEPNRLSNNVMTRPIMQETLFPTLAFVAGDGEISYWALLNDAFKAFDPQIQLPPIIPRLSITLVTERIEKLMDNHVLEPTYIVNNGCQKLQMNWLSTQQNPPVHLLFEQTEENIKHIHEPIQTVASSIGPDLGAKAERNLNNLLKEMQYLKQQTINHLTDKYDLELGKFQEMQLALRPNDGLQERVLNVLAFLNECGPAFIREIIKEDLPFTKDHHLIYVHKLTE